MKLELIELVQIRLPLVHFFETSFGRTTEREIILVRVVDSDGAVGWGECTAGEGPFYSYEWIETAWNTIKRYLAPILIGPEIESASRTFEMMSHVRGHRMAKAALETACWDLEAKRSDIPLWQHLGGTRNEIPCGVSIGIQDSVDELIDKIKTELDAGYQRIKIKIKPGWDTQVLESVRNRFPTMRLMADANSAYRLGDLTHLRSMDQYNLMMIEQPLSHDDIFDHARLQKELRTPICLDESIHSTDDARHALEMGACRIINVKLGRVGGHSEARRVETVCRESGVPVWCGGMLESGIGRSHNIAMSTLEGFSLPGDVSASSRYWTKDIIEPEVIVSRRGTIVPPLSPGIGFEVVRSRIDEVTVRREEMRRS